MKNALLIAALAAAAPSALAADALKHRWESAMVSGSNRLAVYSVLQARPRGSEKFVGSFMRSDGLLHKKGQGAQRIRGFVAAKPLVEHDRNINSGIPAESITLGGLEFIIDENDRAKEGFLLGGQLIAGADYSVAKGHVLSFGGQLAYQYSFEHDLDKKYAGANNCLASHVSQWNWIDSCLGVRVLDQGSKLEEAYASLGYSQMFSSSFAEHEIKLEAQQAFREDYDKLTAGVALISAIEEVGALGLSFRLGEEIEGEHTTLADGSVSLTRPAFDRLTTVGLSHRYMAGGQFFGEDREDHVTTLSLSTELTDLFSVSLDYEYTASTADLYDDESFSIGLIFPSFKF
ncbi:hypothetical protein [Limimaricola pyoseonensis]|uniref:Uncharacterized protein n=1 Tax=Limimaricola pyoseonensis TaxID=521013 RepID=A0A1G7IGJ0_9RHOB|nr:hypothetical protein [Limimaricola pyoseonensis]SDF11817.1 hypothetical protein SAMN04488567_3459 [Limimaricola pyoseonensis]